MPFLEAREVATAPARETSPVDLDGAGEPRGRVRAERPGRKLARRRLDDTASRPVPAEPPPTAGAPG